MNLLQPSLAATRIVPAHKHTTSPPTWCRMMRRTEEHSNDDDQRTNWLAAHAGRTIRFVNLAEIDWIEAAGHYVRLHCGPATYLLRRSLADLESQLNGQFLRFNRSTIGRIGYIDRIDHTDDGRFEVVLRCGTRVRMSPTGRTRFRRALGL